MIGKTIAHYTITEKIGQGGMGEVYRATDTKLKRDVALKILPESFAQDPQRMGRFQREAEVLASLNHPNIAGIHGLEQEGTTHAIAMELVEGETMAARISKGAIPLEESLKIALQIATALEAAHEKGIIHRDLKPANVIVTPEGTAKVLDFGLAKAMEPATSTNDDLSQSPTLTMQATQAGIILGTAAYMSPEQAKGLIADQRSDIWSFGVVLFEMLAGKQPFAGNDITEVLASVVKVDVDWDALPSGVPARVRWWLRRCLRADPKQRWHAIADVRLVIQDHPDDPEADSAKLIPSTSVALWKAPTVWMMVAVAMTLAVSATWFLKPEPDIQEPPLIRITITADQLQQDPAPPVLSPDGRILVYGVAGRLWIRHLDQFDPAPLPNSEGARSPFFSPDSQFLGYGQDGKLWKLHLASGAKSLVCDLPGTIRGATWGMDGSIVFAVLDPGRLYQVSDQGGAPNVLLAGGLGAAVPVLPHLLPGQRGILSNDRGERGINLLVNGKQTTLLSQEGAQFAQAVYSPSGHLIYRRKGSNAGLHAVGFSLSSSQITGEPILIHPHGHWPSVSEDGTLSYWIGADVDVKELVRVDRNGQVIGIIGQPQEYMMQPALSPDGNRVAVTAEQGVTRNIWLHDVQRGTKTRLSSSTEVNDWYPAWTAAGDRVAFHRPVEGRSEIWTIPVAKNRPAEKLTDGRHSHYSSDGRFLVFIRDSEETGQDLWYLEVGEEGKPKEFLVTEQNESQPRLSPDSRWVAYTSDESGHRQIYVKKFPSGEGLWTISTNEGNRPHWSPDGDELFYFQGQDLMVVAVKGTDSLDLGKPTRLFTASGFEEHLTVGEGGDSFILVRPVKNDDTPPSIAIVTNWFSEFRDRQ